jgi:hypothetical protein
MKIKIYILIISKGSGQEEVVANKNTLRTNTEIGPMPQKYYQSANVSVKLSKHCSPAAILNTTIFMGQ